MSKPARLTFSCELKLETIHQLALDGQGAAFSRRPFP